LAPDEGKCGSCRGRRRQKTWRLPHISGVYARIILR